MSTKLEFQKGTSLVTDVAVTSAAPACALRLDIPRLLAKDRDCRLRHHRVLRLRLRYSSDPGPMALQGRRHSGQGGTLQMFSIFLCPAKRRPHAFLGPSRRSVALHLRPVVVRPASPRPAVPRTAGSPHAPSPHAVRALLDDSDRFFIALSATEFPHEFRIAPSLSGRSQGLDA